MRPSAAWISATPCAVAVDPRTVVRVVDAVTPQLSLVQLVVVDRDEYRRSGPASAEQHATAIATPKITRM